MGMGWGIAWAIIVSIGFSLASAGALGAAKCKAIFDKKTGVIQVSAADVDAATLTWSDEASGVFQSFFDPACIKGTKAKRCTLADPATLPAQLPPAGCTVFLSDANGPCSARIRSCVPRPVVRTKDVTLQVADWTGLGHYVIEETAGSGVAEIVDPELSAAKGVEVLAQNPGGYWFLLPVSVTSSDGSIERLQVSHEGDTLRLYYYRFTPPATSASVPSSPLPVRYRIFDAPPN
jgi:hypothetical protein